MTRVELFKFIKKYKSRDRTGASAAYDDVIAGALILQFVVFLLIQDSMSPDETPFRESFYPSPARHLICSFYVVPRGSSAFSSVRYARRTGNRQSCCALPESRIISNSRGPFTRFVNGIKKSGGVIKRGGRRQRDANSRSERRYCSLDSVSLRRAMEYLGWKTTPWQLAMSFRIIYVYMLRVCVCQL